MLSTLGAVRPLPLLSGVGRGFLITEIFGLQRAADGAHQQLDTAEPSAPSRPQRTLFCLIIFYILILRHVLNFSILN